MTALLKSVLLSAALALLTAGAVQAKDEAKASAPAKSSAAASTDKGEKADKGSAKAGALIDINSATEKELASLPKIGEVRAKAIIKGRPYKGKDELVEKKIISQDVYDGIKDRVIAKQSTAGGDKKADAKKSDVKKTEDKKADAMKSEDKKAAEKK